VDIIVDYAKEMILQKHNDRIKIPDIWEGFEKKVKVLPYITKNCFFWYTAQKAYESTLWKLKCK